MRASIVIASHNEGFRLRRTVQSCAENIDGVDYEVVIADDASRDGSVDELLQHYPDVRVVKSRRRLGCSPTKDAAVRIARGDVLVFLDAHCNPEPGAIARLVNDVERLNGNAIVTPSVPELNVRRWQNSTSRIAFGLSLNLETLGGTWMALKKMAAYSDLPRPRLYVSPTFVGCCVAMSRKLYSKLWGFDADMRCWGSEDVDLGLKAWLMGFPVLHDPAAVIGHRFVTRFENYAVPTEHIAAKSSHGPQEFYRSGVGGFLAAPRPARRLALAQSLEDLHASTSERRTRTVVFDASSGTRRILVRQGVWPRVAGRFRVGRTSTKPGTLTKCPPRETRLLRAFGSATLCTRALSAASELPGCFLARAPQNVARPVCAQ